MGFLVSDYDFSKHFFEVLIVVLELKRGFSICIKVLSFMAYELMKLACSILI